MASNKRISIFPNYYRALETPLGPQKIMNRAQLMAEREVPESCTKALLINCILHNVFSYLPHSDLKRLRLVCKIWDEEACRILRKTSKTILNTSQKLVSFHWEKFTSETTTLFENFQLVNVHVATPIMEMFITSFGHQMKHLDLRDSKWTPEDLERILVKVMPNLEELALHGMIPRDARVFQIKTGDTNQDNDEVFKRKGTIVPKIKYIDLHLFEKSADETPLQLFLVDLLACFPNVERIASNETIRKGDMKIKSRRGRFQRILFESLIASEGEDNPVNFKKLSHVDITLTPWDDNQVHMLAVKKYPLTYLSLDILPSVSTNAILSLLKTYKKTLNKLKISFTSWRIVDFPVHQFSLDYVQHLSLDWFNGSLNFLAGLPQLKTVILAQVNINEAFLQIDFKQFADGHPLNTLEAYQLAGTNILLVTIQTIAKIFPRLKKLVMGKLTDESMRGVFTNMPLLEEFSAIEGSFTDEGVTGVPLFSCRQCTKLHLTELCKGVYNEALVNKQRTYPSVASLSNLWKLELRSPKLTNLSVIHGAMMVKHLRSLSLWSCDLTFRSLKKLVDETRLDYLETTHSFMHRVEIVYALKRCRAEKFVLNGQDAPKHFQKGTAESEKFLSQFYPMIRSCDEGRRDNCPYYNWRWAPEQMALHNLVLL